MSPSLRPLSACRVWIISYQGSMFCIQLCRLYCLICDWWIWLWDWHWAKGAHRCDLSKGLKRPRYPVILPRLWKWALRSYWSSRMRYMGQSHTSLCSPWSPGAWSRATSESVITLCSLPPSMGMFCYWLILTNTMIFSWAFINCMYVLLITPIRKD